MDEDKKDQTPIETFSERLQKVKDEVRASASSPKEKQKFVMSSTETDVAQALVRLSANPDFQTYLTFENKEIGELCVKGFELPAQGLMDGASFGEKMAFNKGRLFQMNYIRGGRDTIMKTYLTILDKQKKKGV